MMSLAPPLGVAGGGTPGAPGPPGSPGAPGPPGGALTLIQTITGQNGAFTGIVFNHIPAIYNHLQLRAHASSASVPTAFEIQLNGDTGHHYALFGFNADGPGLVTTVGPPSDGFIDTGWSVTPDTDVGITPQWSIFDLFIYDYLAALPKLAFWNIGFPDNPKLRTLTCTWNQNAAVNTITVRNFTGIGDALFVPTSTFWLYGIK